MTKTIAQCQDWIQSRTLSSYYKNNYREMENHYLDHIVDKISALKPGLVVDIGPGWGTMMAYFAFNGWDVIGVEGYPDFVTPEILKDLSAESGRNVTLTTQDVFELSIPDCKADLITMTMVLPHLHYRPDRAVKRAAALLADDGMFLCSALDDPNIPAKYGYDWQAVPEYPQLDGGVQVVNALYNEKTMDGLMAACFGSYRVWRHGDCVYGSNK